jgi:hypothetical protein
MMIIIPQGTANPFSIAKASVDLRGVLTITPPAVAAALATCGFRPAINLG